MTVAISTDVERAIAIGRDLNAWWTNVEASRAHVERFVLAPGFPGGDAVRGFFGEARAAGVTERYMGYSSDYCFDLAGGTPAEAPQAAAWLVDQAEEFALRYWLRSESWALPEPYDEISQPAERELAGFTNVMQAFKSRVDGTLGQFPEAIARVVVDLRELETTYEWITLRRLAQDLRVSMAVPGSSSVSMSAPLPASSTFALHSDLTVRRRLPGPGIIGEFGAAFSPIPPAGLRSLVRDVDFLQTGLRLQTLRVYDTGEVRLRTATIMRRATGPFEYFVKPLLSAHATHLRDQMLGTRGIWQQTSNWLDASSIPGWLLKQTYAPVL
jgi:hypothetical protein